jgi:hypothetical protein
MPNMIGKVSSTRYAQIVAEARQMVEQQTRCQFKIGELALEIEPMRPHGGAHPHRDEELLTVSEALAMFAEDIGLAPTTVEKLRWVASRWPEDYQQPGVSHYIHQILAAIPDDAERFAAIKTPPVDKRSGQRRWTEATANRRVGYQVRKPETELERLHAIHDMARDEAIAARVTTDFLRRPEVASRAMADDTARHMVNRAQVDRSRQAGDAFRRESPAGRALSRVQHAMEFRGPGRGLSAVRGDRRPGRAAATGSASVRRRTRRRA